MCPPPRSPKRSTSPSATQHTPALPSISDLPVAPSGPHQTAESLPRPAAIECEDSRCDVTLSQPSPAWHVVMSSSQTQNGVRYIKRESRLQLPDLCAGDRSVHLRGIPISPRSIQRRFLLFQDRAGLRVYRSLDAQWLRGSAVGLAGCVRSEE